MIITTKFDNGDKVYFINDAGTIVSTSIGTTTVHVDPATRLKVYVYYTVKHYQNKVDEDKLYHTKEEAAAEWLTSQGMKVGLL